MTAIEASSVSVKTMADNTLRLTVDIEPRFAKDAFALFGERGTAMALAALNPAHEQEPVQEKPKGGALARLAGQWCKDLQFQAFLGVMNSQDAAAMIRTVCRIESRAELDSNPDAAEAFHMHFRGPYQKHLIAIGVTE